MFDKHRNKLGLSCAKLRWSYASQPAHLAYHSTFACPLRLFPSILTNFYCHHIFQNEFRLFSNDQLIYAVFHLQNNWGRLLFIKMWGCLPSSKNLRLSSIHMLEGQFILIRQFGYFSGPRPAGGRAAGTLIIELTQLNFNWNCQLELSLAIGY